MGNAADYIPALKYGHKVYPQSVISGNTPVETGNVWFVDGDKSTGTSGGRTWEDAFTEAQFDGNISALGVTAGDVVYVAGRTMAATDTDPISYTTNLTINVPQVSIIGVSRGRTQGGLPQLKVGGTTTQAIIRVRAPGVMIANIGINGSGATGGGISLDDDGGTTYAAFGWSVLGCHFKNCVGTTATNAATGGAVQISSTGGAWQGLLAGNRFYKNVGDFVAKGTTGSVPQDIVIEDNIFSGPAASVDCNLYVAADGINGLIVKDNIFTGKPAIGSGTNAKYMVFGAGTVGILANNYFASITGEAETDVTFGASGAGATIPTTMFISGNYGETGAANTNAGEQTSDIFRT